MTPRVQTARPARFPVAPGLVGRGSPGARPSGRARPRIGAGAARAGVPAGAAPVARRSPPGATGRGRDGAAQRPARRRPAGPQRFWFARNPLKSHKTRKYKFSWIFGGSAGRRDRGGAAGARPCDGAGRLRGAARSAAQRGRRAALGAARLLSAPRARDPASRARRPAASRAGPAAARPGLRRFWFARSPLKSHKTRKYKFQKISPDFPGPGPGGTRRDRGPTAAKNAAAP